MSLKKSAIALATAAILGTSAQAYAAYAMPTAEPAPVNTGNWYVNLFGGVAFTSDTNLVPGGARLTYDSAGFDVGGAFGYRSGPFRYELQYTFIRSGHDKLATVANNGDTDVHAGLANIYYTFENISDIFRPYIGGGVGIAYVNASNIPTTKSSQTEFAYQGTIGMLFSVDDNFDVDLGYRFVGVTQPTSIFTKSVNNHLVNLGVTYHIV